MGLASGEFRMLEGSVSVVSPGAYAVADGGGEVDGCVGQGLFYRDVRHLSEFHLEVNGELPDTVASRTRGSAAEFVQSVGADRGANHRADRGNGRHQGLRQECAEHPGPAAFFMRMATLGGSIA
jgi:hypothetical protein